MSSTNWLNEEEMRLWRAFISTSGAMGTAMDNAMRASSDLKLDDYEVLVHLSESEGRRLRMSELSNRHMHSKSRLSQRVDRLEARGLVTREKCNEDARGTWAVLTNEGFSTLEALAPTHLEHVRELFFDHIDKSDIPALIRSLEAVADNMRD